MKENLMNFSAFESLYESYGMVSEAEIDVPKSSSPDLQVVEPGSSKPKEAKNPIDDLLAIFSEIDVKKTENKKTEEVNEDDEDPVDAVPKKKASTGKGSGNIKPVKTKVKQTPLVKALSLKLMKMGENSERVKEVQKVLKLDPTGKFDQALKEKVKDFQRENGLLVDGIVGVQTYGALLQVKKGITDMEEIQKMIEALGKLTPFIILDPRFYGVARSCTIVTVNNITYVIVIPSENAKAGVDQMKKDGVLTSGYEWIGSLGQAVGKALVYTVSGIILLPLLAATALIQASVSVVKFAAQGIYSVCSDVLTGMKQLGVWATTKIENNWKTFKKDSADQIAFVKGFAQTVGEGLKSSAEGLISFAGALGAGLLSLPGAFAMAAWEGIKGFGKILGKAWAGIQSGAKSLVEGAKKGIEFLGDKAKTLVQGVKSGVTQITNGVVTLGAAAVSAAGSVVKGAVQILGAGLSYAGSMIKSSGDWLQSLVQECYEETGNPLYEGLLLEMAL